MDADIRQITTHTGEMTAGVRTVDLDIDDTLRFEPMQLMFEMFRRDDVVFLMRHGPTDWSRFDEKDVAPQDCENQRVMIEEGKGRMRDLGSLLAANGIFPSQIVVSEWCRNQQTVDALLLGIGRVDPDAAMNMPVETDSELNLLLSLQGAPDVVSLRERISNWSGDPDRKGPLLIVTHFTNIDELTEFRVLEGEILVVDPKRDNRVLGYLRLRSAKPDIGHFAEALDSPLNTDDVALSMMERYLAALNSRDRAQLREILSEDWIMHGMSPEDPVLGLESYISELMVYDAGLSQPSFEFEHLSASGDTVTAIGKIRGRHTGWLMGLPPTGRDVEVGAMTVHRIEDGEIAETWQMIDQLSLRDQLTEDEG